MPEGGLRWALVTLGVVFTVSGLAKVPAREKTGLSAFEELGWRGYAFDSLEKPIRIHPRLRPLWRTLVSVAPANTRCDRLGHCDKLNQPLIGNTFAHYTVTALLGKGGMGEVYRARDLKLDRDVALKFLPATHSNDPERTARFEREARALASLEHPNIATIYGLHDEGAVRFMAMELINGTTLETKVVEGGGQMMGTVPYMAPEQLEGRAVDARADVFAIGVILYELAAGKRPFVANSTLGLSSAILHETPAPLTEVRPDLPADFARVIRRCLEKKVERRMQTARDVFNELEDLRTGVVTAALPAFPAPADSHGSLVEHRMRITTEQVRTLSVHLPRMIGDHMTYLDNERRSDVLLICLHGIGTDQRDFAEVLRDTSYRAVALSLYGFSPVARMRPALPYADHNRLAGFLIEDIHRTIAPKTLVLVGHSSGADQLLRIVASPLGEGLRPDGLVLLGPAVVPGEGRMSGPLCRLTGDPADTFSRLRGMSAYADNLNEWLIVHDYLVRAFEKFTNDPAALKSFAETYVESLSDDSFFDLLRTAINRGRHLRCIFANDDTADIDRALGRHIRDNALGNDFKEEMIANAPVGHIALRGPDVVLPQIEEVLARLGS